MLFGSKQSLHKFKDVSLIYNGVSTERVEKFKYLGVTFDPQLSWNDHANYLSSIISKRIGVIYRVKHYLPNKIINMLAQALVFPHFDYCSSVWSNFSMHHSNELQILQNRLARVLLSADIRTSVDKMLKDLDWVRLTHRLAKTRATHRQLGIGSVSKKQNKTKKSKTKQNKNKQTKN